MTRLTILLAIGIALGAMASCGRHAHTGEQAPAGPTDPEIIRAAWDALITDIEKRDAALGASLRQAQDDGDQATGENLLTRIIGEGSWNTSLPHALRGLMRLRRYQVTEAIQDLIAAQTRGDMSRDLKMLIQRERVKLDQVFADAERKGQDPSPVALMYDIRIAISDLIGRDDKLEEYLGSLFIHESMLPYAAVRRGYLRLSLGRFDAAEADFLLANRSNPDESTTTDIETGMRLVDAFRSGSEEVKDAVPHMRLLRNLPESPWDLDDFRLEYARTLLDNKLYDWLEIVVNQLRRRELDPAEDGVILAYTGEIQWVRDQYEDAYATFTDTLNVIRHRSFRASTLFRMAEYHAMRNERDKAIELAEQSAAILPMDHWVQHRVGVFLLGLDELDKGLSYLEQAREAANTPETKAQSHAALADMYLRRGDREKYIDEAAKYIDEASTSPPPVSPSTTALLAYYQGEVHLARGDLDGAAEHFERAVLLTANKYRLSDIYMKLSDLSVQRGDREKAVDYVKRSVEIMPDQAWKVRQAGIALVRLGELEEGATLIGRSGEMDAAPRHKALALTTLAEGYRQGGFPEEFRRYAREYVDVVDAFPDAAPAEKGMAEYYRGEILGAEGKADEAFFAYRNAAGMLTDRFRLSDSYLAMAEYEAKRSDREKAAEYAEKAAALLPEAHWRIVQVGELFTRLGMPDKALEYLAKGARDAAAARGHAAMAEAYRLAGDAEKYREYAQRYIDETTAKGSVTPEEEGRVAFYEGEIHAVRGEWEQAHAAYERASGLVKDSLGLADIYAKLASCLAKLGDPEKAAEYMERSVALYPEQIWKLRQAGDFYSDLNMTDKAIAYYEDALARSAAPAERISLYAGLAESHKRKRDAEQYLIFAARHNKALDERGEPFTPAEQGLYAYYQGELLAAAEMPDDASREYKLASTLVGSPVLLSDIFYKLAQYHAKRSERDPAVDYMKKSVAFYPESSWKLRQAGEVYFSLDMLDAAIESYELALKHSTATLTDSVAVYAGIAEFHRRLRRRDEYLRYAAMYADAVAARGGDSSKAEEALRAYYEGEILSAGNEPGPANEAYARAVGLFQDDPVRLSDCYMRMAEYQARFGRRDLAVEYGERSLALLPNQAWRLQEGGDLFLGVDGMIDRAIELYAGAVEYSGSLTAKAAATSALADAHKIKGATAEYAAHARRYIEILDERGIEPTDAEKGLRHYYLAETNLQSEDCELSYREYEEAAKYVAEKNRLADIYMRMAEHLARHNDREAALSYAERSGDLLADQSWKLRQVGDFFARQYELEKALSYMDEAMKLAKTVHDEAGVHMARADTYRAASTQVGNDERIIDLAERTRLRREMNEKFVENARIYIETVKGMGETESTETERGIQCFYSGLLSMMEEEREKQAYAAFEQANRLLKDVYRRSEALLIMARLNAEWDNDDLAHAQACEAARLVPAAGWRIGDLSRVLVDIERYEDAKCILFRALEQRPQDNISLNRELAYAFVESGDRETGMCYNRKYIDYMTDIIEERGGPDCVTRKHLDEWWDARSRQAGWSKRNWDFDYYLWWSRQAEGNHTLGNMFEATRYFKWWNNRSGKAYGQIGGTLDSRYSGYSWDDIRKRDVPWQSNPDLKDTLYALIGVSVNPFKRLSPLSVGAEQVFGLGREVDDDFRFRVLWDKDHGADPRPYGRVWGYTATWVDNIYSTRERNFTSDGTLTKGVTTVPFCNNRNLLVIPYGEVGYDYGGTKAERDDRFGMEGSLGVMFRQWFREDRYHTPRAYAQLNLYYRVGFTSNRENAWGLGFHASF